MILALNCGSSSLKFGAYERHQGDVRLVFENEIEDTGGHDYVTALARSLALLKEKGLQQFEAVGHRFVHGGPNLRDHFLLTNATEHELQIASDFAPLHMPPALAVLRAAKDRMPGAKQIVCLDTAFHRTMPDIAQTFALPRDIRNLGVHRYGFHGLSVESIVSQLKSVPGKLVVAHLGNGASVTAIRNGRSIDTSMGMTPTGGFMMGTRCGDLDPGVMIFLLRHGYQSAEAFENVFDRESGLLGVSGLTNDVRKLTAAQAANPDADLALRLFVYQVSKTIASMAAALGGLDLLVFTGGIGEHVEPLRKEIAAAVRFLGNHEVHVLPSEEDEQIARITSRLISL